MTMSEYRMDKRDALVLIARLAEAVRNTRNTWVTVEMDDTGGMVRLYVGDGVFPANYTGYMELVNHDHAA